MTRAFLLATSGALLGLAISAAHADPLTVTAGVGDLPAFSGGEAVNFDDPIPADIHLTTGGVARIVSGTVQTNSSPTLDGYAAPYLSGGQGALVGSPNGPDVTNYLKAGAPGGAAYFLFDNPQTSLYYIHGSDDLLNMVFFSGSTMIGSLSGGDIANAAGAPPPTGDQGPNGTFGVNISSTVPITRVDFNSDQFIALEISYLSVAGASSSTNTSEPTSLVLLGAALLGLGFVRHRARAGDSAAA